MIYRKFGNKYILRIDKGEEILQNLKEFCIMKNIKLGIVSGIGAVNKLIIGYFETGTRQYQQREFVGNYEIASLIGNISTMNDEVYFHVHISLSDSTYNTFGGHLNSATVSSTCEVVIDVMDGEFRRTYDKGIGLNLLK